MAAATKAALNFQTQGEEIIHGRGVVLVEGRGVAAPIGVEVGAVVLAVSRDVEDSTILLREVQGLMRTS